jgi:hypothetical protein
MRFATIAGMVIIVPLALAGCSSSAAPTPAPTAPRTIGLTGTQLKAALVTDVPKGFTQNKSSTVDSGDDPQQPVANAMMSKSHCADLNATAFIQASGASGVGFAQSDYLDSKANEISEEIDSFLSPAAATKALTSLRKFFGQCAKFKYKQDGTTFTVKLVTSAAAGLGAGAFKGTMTSSRWMGGSTLVAAQQGGCVVTAFYSTQSSSRGSEILGIVAKIEKNLTGAP